MSCTCASLTLAGLCRDCDANVGGIQVVYITTSNSVSGISYDSGNTKITGITLSSGASFYEYQFRKNTGSMTSTLNVTDDGNTYVSTELSLVFGKMQTRSRIEMNALSLSDLFVIVKDANGKYWALGTEDPVTASGGAGETGTNRTDPNRYTITLSEVAASFPFEVDASVIEGLEIVEGTN